MPLTSSQQNFLSNVWPFAVQAGQQTGLSPSVIAAQAALESGWGKSAPGNNFFGIKGSGQTQSTTEYVNGTPTKTTQGFATFSSLKDSVQGFADFINGNQRYSTVNDSSDPNKQADALASAGYATDPNYASKLKSIMDSFNNDGNGIPGFNMDGYNPASGEGTDTQTAQTTVGGWQEAIANFFSVHTQIRVGAVIVGILLLAVAIVFLMKTAYDNSPTAQAVVAKVATTAAVAA